MSGEMFQVIFNSQGSNIVNNADINNVIFAVNWGAFLPKKYKKFHCQFIFKSQNYNGILINNGFVNMNIGRLNCYDGLQMSSNLGIIYPVMVNNTAGNLSSYYNSTNNDNNDFWIDYPQNTNITVKLTTFAGVSIANMQPYTLIMNLIGVLDKELENS